MKQTFAQVAFLKKIDIVFQCLLFIGMIVTIAASALHIFGLYVMAAGQCVSAVAWAIKSQELPQPYAGSKLRLVIIIVCIALLLLLLISETAFFMASLAMLLAGPVLGIWYFVLTVREMNYYAKARKPYYLL